MFIISHLQLLSADFCLCQAVSFGQYGNYIDFFMQGLHTLHIQRSKTEHTCIDICPKGGKQLSGEAVAVTVVLVQLMSRGTTCFSLPVANRRDEVETAVDSVVLDVPSV